jgi:two-component system sensor histidine kinase TctE
MRSDRLSLRQRLLLWLLPALMLLTCLWVWATYTIVLHFANLAYDRGLEDSVLTLAGQVRIDGGRVDINLPQAAQQMLEFDEVDSVYYSISDGRGRLLAGNRDLPRTAVDSLRQVASFRDIRIDGHPARMAEYLVTGAGAPVSVRVAETVHKREILAREALIFMALPQLLFVGGIAGLVWYGVGVGMAPLRRIRDAISRRTHEDLSPIDEAGLPAEVHEQVHVINDLMRRLGRTIAGQRRFIADATHQLRTPITVLRTQTEMALRADDAHLRGFVMQMDGATARLVRLANQLLNLSRAEASLEGLIEFGTVDLGEVMEEAVAALVPAALARKVELRLDVADPAPQVRGDRQLLAEMTGNVIDNAVRYTPSGGHVRVHVQAGAGRAQISVADDGPGIPAAERDRVLLRFHRGEEATSEGSGLGLAIASEIALAHGGCLEFASPAGEPGLTVRIELPMAGTDGSEQRQAAAQR